MALTTTPLLDEIELPPDPFPGDPFPGQPAPPPEPSPVVEPVEPLEPLDPQTFPGGPPLTEPARPEPEPV